MLGWDSGCMCLHASISRALSAYCQNSICHVHVLLFWWTGGAFNKSNPKTDIEWVMHRAKQTPGPGRWVWLLHGNSRWHELLYDTIFVDRWIYRDPWSYDDPWIYNDSWIHRDPWIYRDRDHCHIIHNHISTIAGTWMIARWPVWPNQAVRGRNTSRNRTWSGQWTGHPRCLDPANTKSKPQGQPSIRPSATSSPNPS